MRLWVGALSIVALVVLCLVSVSVLASDLNEVTIGAHVLNSAPAVDVELTPDDDPATLGVQVINPDNTTNKTVTITASVTDMNGWDDLTGVVTATITGPSVVEDSPVRLSFDHAVNVTTAHYNGTFNISNHGEGGYAVEVMAADFGGLTGVGSKNFSYRYDLVCTYAIWANSTVHNQAIRWAGSRNVVNGTVHSNNNLRVSGSNNLVNGATEYVSSFIDTGKNNTFIPPPIQVTPEPFPLLYNITAYKPGGSEAIAAGDTYHHIKGRFHISDSDAVLEGLYYVEGDVKFSGSNISGVFTIVAEEKIDISASKHNCIAYTTNLLFLSCNEDVKIAVSNSNFCGVIHAEKGAIELSNSRNTIHGGLFADTVKLPASDLTINAGQATGGCNILASSVLHASGAFRKQHNEKPPSSNDNPRDAFTVKQYGYIKGGDGTMQEDASVANGFYAIQKFHFSIAEPESSITKLDILWDGKGAHDWGTDGATLYVWNYETGMYEQLDASNDAYITLKGTIADTIGDYIDDGSLIIIAEQNSPQWRWWRLTFRSRLGTDYVTVKVFEEVD